MGGRIVVSAVDGHIAREADSTHGLAGPHQPQWDRFVLRFSNGTALRLVDRRRLGRVTIDPDIDGLGPDALLATRAEFDAAILRSRSPIKARLLDQTAISGIGNLIADETLWRANIAPTRPSNSLTTNDLRALFRCARQALRSAVKHGGSHTGRLIAHRHEGGHCPRCGSLLTFLRVGGRSTWSCPHEQR
jgi:formamidopyrimidine-DNA glycosylase